MLSLRGNCWQPWQTNSALALTGLLLIFLCQQGINEIHHYVIGFGLVAMYQSLLYLVAAWVVLNGPADRWTLVIILLCAAACRLVCLFSPPFLSSDIFRYVWDGRVQAAGINPYRYIPADPHLAFLRDGDIYPHINRRSYAHTIYPPGAQVLFLLITRLGESVRTMKAGMIGLEALTVWVLVKLYPIVLFPALYRRSEMRVSGWKMPAAIAALVAAGYACYLSVGTLVLGFLPDYAKEEGLESGSRYFLLTQVRNTLHWQSIPTGAFYVFAAMLLLGLAILAWLNPAYLAKFPYTKQGGQHALPSGLGYGFAIAVALMLLFSSHYPWYYLWLLPFVCLMPYVPMLYFITACFYLYTTSLANPGPAMFYMFQWLYATTALLALWCLGNAYASNHPSVRKP